jgi:hypothetical protein
MIQSSRTKWIRTNATLEFILELKNIKMTTVKVITVHINKTHVKFWEWKFKFWAHSQTVQDIPRIVPPCSGITIFLGTDGTTLNPNRVKFFSENIDTPCLNILSFLRYLIKRNGPNIFFKLVPILHFSLTPLNFDLAEQYCKVFF